MTGIGGNVSLERGDAMRRRVSELGISLRALENACGVDRKTLGKAMRGDPCVRVSTWTAIETCLDKLEGSSERERLLLQAQALEDAGRWAEQPDAPTGMRGVLRSQDLYLRAAALRTKAS